MGIRTVSAMKQSVSEPVEWLPRPNNAGVFHKIEIVDEVLAADCVMQRVKIRQLCDLQDPNVELACLIGYVQVKHPLKPELWFWRDKFWLKGVGTDGLEHYYNQQYLLYPVTVAREAELIASVKLV